MHITGVVHVGAHLAEEAPIYDRLKVPVLWFEANADVFPQVHETLNNYASQALYPIPVVIADQQGAPKLFRITNYDGMSSSIYKWGTHTQFSPDTVHVREEWRVTDTLDALLFSEADVLTVDLMSPFNMLNIDVEGAGLDVLKGAEETLEQIDYVYIEVQTENVYDGAPLLDEYDTWLGERGFVQIALGIVEGQGWGDALYERLPDGYQ